MAEPQFKDNKPQVKRRKILPTVKPTKVLVTSPKPGTSTEPNAATQSETKVKSVSRRSSCKTKFLGRRISHEWKLSEVSDITKWYCGTVTAVISGVDGSPNAIYEVTYDEEDEGFEVDHLVEDFRTGSVKFIDI